MNAEATAVLVSGLLILFLVVATLVASVSGITEAQQDEQGQSGNANSASRGAGPPGAPDETGGPSENQSQAEAGADDERAQSGGGVFDLVRAWGPYVTAATLGLAAIAAIFAVLSVKSTRQTARARVLVRLARPRERRSRFEVLNFGPTVALLRGWWSKDAAGAATADIEAALSEGRVEWKRTLGPGEAIVLPLVDAPTAAKVLIAVEFEDVFGVPRQAWGLFVRKEDEDYTTSEDGELPGAWWAE